MDPFCRCLALAALVCAPAWCLGALPGLPETPPPAMSRAPGAAAIVEQIGELEGVRDPKCHATASRLEDLIYGTPLGTQARFAKDTLQKDMAMAIWVAAARRAAAQGLRETPASLVQDEVRRLMRFDQAPGGHWKVRIGDRETVIDATDHRQYASVAYALRAILAAEQDMLMGAEASDLLPLSRDATAALKQAIELLTLATLQGLDRRARAADRHQIDEAELRAAWPGAAHAQPATTLTAAPAQPPATLPAATATNAGFDLLRQIIGQKLQSYEQYNDVSSKVFLRNLQVYFARHGWPRDAQQATAFRQLYNAAMVAFAHDLLAGAEAEALRRGERLVRAADVEAFAQRLLPHRLNEYEDAIFFPHLAPPQRVEIEAYDMDAFRDGGLHWRYLLDVIDAPGFEARLGPDPFAAELLSENVAQFGVLLLRIAGRLGREQGSETLQPRLIEPALRWIQARIDEHARTPPPLAAQDRLASAPVARRAEAGQRFSDVTAASGVAYQHRSSDWLARLIRSYALRSDRVGVLAIPPAFQGSGVASEDLDGDGWPDLLLLGGGGNRLYRNQGGTGFSDVTAASGIDWRRPDGQPGEPRQPLLVDFDNDGRPDIFISYANDGHRLYRNLGGMRFEDVTERAGLGGEGLVGGPATALDLDKDGLPDLYIGYFGDYPNGVGPTLARRNTNGQPDKLLRNKGGFVFEDVTAASGIANRGWTQAVAHTDLDADGWQDIIAGNDFGANVYYRNLGDGRFEDVTEQIGAGKPSYTMGIGIADLNRDDRPDIYISNIVVMNKDEKYVNPGADTPMKFDPDKLANMRVVEANDLFMSSVGEHGLTSYELSRRVGRGYSSTGWSWFADFFDMDNDGDDDLYVVNGVNPYFVYSSINPYYVDPEGVSRDVHIPVESDRGNVLFENHGGLLHNVSQGSGVDYPGVSRSAVFVDHDGDGDLDMVLNNLQERAVVYRNETGKAHRWLQLRLIGDPSRKTSRDALGARIVVDTEDGGRVWREVHSASGYLSAHPKEQHVGLGSASTARVSVLWPNGQRDVFADVAADARYLITQSDGALRPAPPRSARSPEPAQPARGLRP